jgi:hypothetical protein
VLGSKLLEKVFGMGKEDLPKLFAQITTALNKRDIMIYLPNNQLATLLDANNFTGEIRKTDGDYLYIVDSNLGGTKANYYVTEKADYTINSVTRDGLLRAELTITYTHTGTDSSWPSGPYTDYVRVITQKGTKLTDAKILDSDGKEINIFKEVVINEVAGLPSYETAFKLEPSKNITLKFMYDLPESMIITMQNKKYTLLWQRQAGTPDNEISFTFKAPFGVKPEVYSQDLKVVDDSAILKTNLDRDKELYLGLK